jgi:hypothetical protein
MIIMGARIFRKIENNVQRGRLNGQGWIWHSTIHRASAPTR